MNTNHYEKEINLLDFAFYLFHRWKSALVGMISGAVVLTGYGFIAGGQFSSIIKYFIAGLIVGMAAVCGYHFVIYAFLGYVRVPEELSDKYGYLLLNTVDDLDEKTCQLITQKIQMLAGKETDIVFTGTLSATEYEALYTALQNNNSEQNLHFSVAECPMKNAESLKKIVGKQIVLVEKISVTKTTELDELATFLAASKIQVVGVIALKQ